MKKSSTQEKGGKGAEYLEGAFLYDWGWSQPHWIEKWQQLKKTEPEGHRAKVTGQRKSVRHQKSYRAANEGNEKKGKQWKDVTEVSHSWEARMKDNRKGICHWVPLGKPLSSSIVHNSILIWVAGSTYGWFGLQYWLFSGVSVFWI